MRAWTLIGAAAGFLVGVGCGCGYALSIMRAGHGDNDLALAVLFMAPIWGACLGAALGWVAGRKR